MRKFGRHNRDVKSRIIELSAADKATLCAMSEIYTQENYHRGVSEGKPMRPSGIVPAHFTPHIIDRVFSGYEQLRKNHDDITGELKFNFCSYAFDKDPNGTFWPWSCWISFNYKKIPLAFRVMSQSRVIMMDRTRSEADKMTHLAESLAHILDRGAMVISSDFKAYSQTHELLRALMPDRVLMHGQQITPVYKRALTFVARDAKELGVLTGDPSMLETLARFAGTWSPGQEAVQNSPDDFFHHPGQYVL